MSERDLVDFVRAVAVGVCVSLLVRALTSDDAPVPAAARPAPTPKQLPKR